MTDDTSRISALVAFIHTKEKEWAEAEQQVLTKLSQIRSRSPDIELPPVLSEMLRKHQTRRELAT